MRPDLQDWNECDPNCRWSVSAGNLWHLRFDTVTETTTRWLPHTRGLAGSYIRNTPGNPKMTSHLHTSSFDAVSAPRPEAARPHHQQGLGAGHRACQRPSPTSSRRVPEKGHACAEAEVGEAWTRRVLDTASPSVRAAFPSLSHVINVAGLPRSLHDGSRVGLAVSAASGGTDTPSCTDT